MNVDVETLAEKIHQTAVNKGWWEGDRNLTEARMLIITELSEAVEADREGRHADLEEFESQLKTNLSAAAVNNFREDKPYLVTPEDKQVYKYQFNNWVKDTVEDELADVVIRILDLLYFESDGDMQSAMGDKNHLSVRVNDNFATSIYEVCKLVPESLSFALYLVEELCKELRIDLYYHVSLKMNYNTLREYKHGNKKY